MINPPFIEGGITFIFWAELSCGTTFMKEGVFWKMGRAMMKSTRVKVTGAARFYLL